MDSFGLLLVDDSEANGCNNECIHSPWNNPTSAHTVEPSSSPTPTALTLKSAPASGPWSHGGLPWKVPPSIRACHADYCGLPRRKDISAPPRSAGDQTRGAAGAWWISAVWMPGLSDGPVPELVTNAEYVIRPSGSLAETSTGSAGEGPGLSDSRLSSWLLEGRGAANAQRCDWCGIP